MSLVPRPCLERGCTEYAYDASRCAKHETAFEKKRKIDGTGRRGTSAEWAKIRERALNRDDRKCVRCAVPEHLERVQSRSLTVHHVDGNPSNNALSNVISLCVECHKTETALIRASRSRTWPK